MGLALLDVADAIRPHPEVVAFLRRRRARPGRRLPRRAARRCPAGPRRRRRDRGLPRQVRDALRRRDRHHQAALERAARRSVPVILANVGNIGPGEAERRFERGRQGAGRRKREAAGAPARPARRRGEGGGDQADDRPPPHLRRLPRVPEVRDGEPLLHLQAGAAAGGRAPRAGRRAPRGRTSSSCASRSSREVVAHRPGRRAAHRRAQGGVPGAPGAHPAAGAHLRRRGRRRVVPARRRAGRRAGRAAGLGRDGRGAGTCRPRHRPAADLEPGDILVTTSTDPSWTPLFVTDRGPGDRGRRPDDARCGDRPRVRPAGGRRGRARDRG